MISGKNVSIMQKVPDTFCPAKWDELSTNLNYNWAYACCKAKPIKFVKDFKEVITQQQENLLNGIQDDSCNYCWSIENAGGESLRHIYIKNFDKTKFDSYSTFNRQISKLEVNIGNSCNLQCIYCNAKFSSQWEKDLNFKKYPIVTDRYVYESEVKNPSKKTDNLNFIRKINPKRLLIIGGEPLYHKDFLELLEAVNSEEIEFSSNLMVDQKILDKVINYQSKFKKMIINASIEAVDGTASYLRHGLDADNFFENLRYLLDNSDSARTEFKILSLATNISVFEMKDLANKLNQIKENSDKDFTWFISYCATPKIHSFYALPNNTRDFIITNLEQIKTSFKTTGMPVIIDALKTIKFKENIHKEFAYFIREWESRKNISLNPTLKEFLCLN
jgi:organic radical activating enzyme